MICLISYSVRKVFTNCESVLLQTQLFLAEAVLQTERHTLSKNVIYCYNSKSQTSLNSTKNAICVQYQSKKKACSSNSPLPFNRSISNPIKLCYPSTSSTSNLTSHGEPSNLVASLLRFSLKSNAMSGRSRPLKFINSNSLGADHNSWTGVGEAFGKYWLVWVCSYWKQPLSNLPRWSDGCCAKVQARKSRRIHTDLGCAGAVDGTTFKRLQGCKTKHTSTYQYYLIRPLWMNSQNSASAHNACSRWRNAQKKRNWFGLTPMSNKGHVRPCEKLHVLDRVLPRSIRSCLIGGIGGT